MNTILWQFQNKFIITFSYTIFHTLIFFPTTHASQVFFTSLFSEETKHKKQNKNINNLDKRKTQSKKKKQKSAYTMLYQMPCICITNVTIRYNESV